MDERIVCRLCGKELTGECERKYHLCDDDLTLVSEASNMLKPLVIAFKRGK